MAERVALVTGAASGIGAATAVRLARGGAAVAVVDRAPDGLGETAGRIEEVGGRAHVVPADLTEPGAADDAVASCVDALGRLDVLVPAAGITRRNAAPDTTDEEWSARSMST